MRSWPTHCGKSPVALLAEGVDRNGLPLPDGVISDVALLAEGVDRNLLLRFTAAAQAGRPPRGGRG